MGGIDDISVFSQYSRSQDKCIFFREFMACSEDIGVATNFMTKKNKPLNVMLEIDVANYKSLGIPSPVKLAQWSQYETEKEVLFPLLSAFKVDKVTLSGDGKKATLKVKYVFAAIDPTAAFIYAFS